MNELNILREQINHIDAQIVKLLCERFAVVENVAEYKKVHGLEILQQSREAEVLQKIAEHIGANSVHPQNQKEYTKYILEIYAVILETSKSLQRKNIK